MATEIGVLYNKIKERIREAAKKEEIKRIIAVAKKELEKIKEEIENREKELEKLIKSLEGLVVYEDSNVRVILNISKIRYRFELEEFLEVFSSFVETFFDGDRLNLVKLLRALLDIESDEELIREIELRSDISKENFKDTKFEFIIDFDPVCSDLVINCIAKLKNKEVEIKENFEYKRKSSKKSKKVMQILGKNLETLEKIIELFNEIEDLENIGEKLGALACILQEFF